ncbi:MAG: hypothetical protein A2X94_02630 [Bdellovibrionales bacterium GWB1_55_8]|nr:MAG: hypothetical protein A2X94_02630 [Bdellovibrionales bacterium GWB1_55_8]
MNSAILRSKLLTLLSALSATAIVAQAYPAAANAAPPRPSSSPSQEITVTLFGQPCLIAGPLNKSVLKEIHSISPEQIFPAEASDLNAEPVKRSFEKLKATQGIPPALDRYREKLLKRLEAQLAFLDGLAAAKKAHKSGPLLASISKFTAGKRTQEFDALLRKTDFAGSVGAENASQLLELLLDVVESDPEEEFHRAIQKLNVQYTCVFADEISAGEDEEVETAEETSNTSRSGRSDGQ